MVAPINNSYAIIIGSQMAINPFLLPAIVNGIPSSVQGATSAINEFLDNREPDRTRARFDQSEDPGKYIDDSDPSYIANKYAIKYPTDFPLVYVSFAFMEYKRPSQFEPLKTDGIKNYISLPIPSNLVDSSKLDYGIAKGGVLGEALANLIRSTEASATNADGLIDSLKKRVLSTEGLTNILQGAGAAGIGATLSAARGIAGNDIVDGALSAAGIAENPFSTVVFKGPELKTHQFTWNFSPNNEDESSIVKTIINTFKKAAYPELMELGAGGFYKYPMIVIPNFGPTEIAENLYRFKPCVISGIDVDYAPQKVPGFFGRTKAPVNISFSISLNEIELWRNGDNDSLLDGKLPTVGNGDFNDIASPRVIDLGNVGGGGL
jgi:hypothetical protein